jgi:hypothetical protein
MADAAHPGDRWTVTFQDEKTVPVVVDGTVPPEKPAVRKAPGKGPDGRQGTLL